MALQKIINKNKPYRCSDNPNFCEGQYNYEDGVMLGVEGYKELYSVMHSSDNSPKIENLQNEYLNVPGYIYGLGKLKLTQIRITENTGDDHYNDDFRIYILDDSFVPEIETAANYDDIRAVGGDIETYRWARIRNLDSCTAGQDQQYDAPGNITESTCAHWHDPGTDWKCQCGNDDEVGEEASFGDCWELDQFPYVINERGSEISAGWSSTIDAYSFTNHPDSNNPWSAEDGNYYIVVWAKGSECNWDLGGPYGRSRTPRIKKYTIPKSYVYDAWKTGKNLCVRFGNSNSCSDPDATTIDLAEPSHHNGPSGQYGSPAWDISDLIIEWEAPVDGYNPYTDPNYPYTSNINFLDTNAPQYHLLRPDNNLVYHREYDPMDEETYLDSEHIFDFRPISFIETEENFDLQSFYSGTEYYNTTAPITVNLSFRIAENRDIWFPEYLGYDNTNPYVYTNNSTINDWRKQKFMFAVIDWDTDNFELDWDDIEFPTSFQSLQSKQDNFNTFNYIDLTNSSGFATDGDLYQNLTHTYNDSGVKIIKALVFSYKSADFDDTYIQPLRWKLITIKLYLGLDSVFVEDFGDIISENIVYVPWPYTPIVIGGISTQSQYINSLDTIFKENKFDELEFDEESKFKNAYDVSPLGDRNEMGQHIGKVDIQQVRYFESSYDMTDLLMIDDVYDNFVRYDDWEYWFDSNDYPNNPKWPTDSCVGMIFISDSSDSELVNKCNIELNMGDLEYNTYNDTTGLGHKGYAMGDFSVRKPNVGENARRETPIEFYQVETDERAI